MRVSEEQKNQNRRMILETAARLFRERGIERTAVADLMHEAGFTHGGFYNHFESKEALVTAVGEDWLARGRGRTLSFDGSDKTWRRYVEAYLSTAHRDDRAGGCLVGALAGEVAGQPEGLQACIARGTAETLDLLAGRFSHLTRAAARREATAAWATMVGALTLARAVAKSNPALSDEILASCRKTLLA